jgi:hypothetical protein
MFLVTIRRASVILLIATSLSLSVYNLFRLMQNWDSHVGEKNEVSIWENRLHSIKEALPADINYVGYVAEWDLPDGQYGLTDQMNEFQLTKYTLAPAIVRRGIDYPWIIGNFSTRKFRPWLQGKIGNYEIKEIGGGIYLIHRVQK